MVIYKEFFGWHETEGTKPKEKKSLSNFLKGGG